jgi:hypothetical protein
VGKHWGLHTAEASVDVAKHVADQWAHESEDRNNNDSDQNKDQRVLYQTLALFFLREEHGFFLLSFRFLWMTRVMLIIQEAFFFAIGTSLFLSTILLGLGVFSLQFY